jgi:hypothetical protein
MHQYVGRLDADADGMGQQTENGMRSCLRHLFGRSSRAISIAFNLIHSEAKTL